MNWIEYYKAVVSAREWAIRKNFKVDPSEISQIDFVNTVCYYKQVWSIKEGLTKK